MPFLCVFDLKTDANGHRAGLQKESVKEMHGAMEMLDKLTEEQ